jgi:hypothetical protein
MMAGDSASAPSTRSSKRAAATGRFMSAGVAAFQVRTSTTNGPARPRDSTSARTVRAGPHAYVVARSEPSASPSRAPSEAQSAGGDRTERLARHDVDPRTPSRELEIDDRA